MYSCSRALINLRVNHQEATPTTNRRYTERTVPEKLAPPGVMAAAIAEPDPLRETGRYERVQSLGKGAFGFVQLGRKLHNNELAAIKFLKRCDVNKYVESEILNHR